MRIRGVVASLFAVFVAGTCRMSVASSPDLSEAVERTQLASDMRLSRLNEMFGEDRAPTARVVAELEHLFRSQDRALQDLCVSWVAVHSEIGALERTEIFRRLLASDPNADLAPAILRSVVRAEVGRMSREERRALYETAVRDGEVTIRGVAIKGLEALGMAAKEGVSEVLPWLPKYRAALEGTSNVWGSSNADVVRVMLEMRAGAADRAAAVRLHAERLGGLPDEDVGRRLRNDGAFAMATQMLIEEACDPGSGGSACSVVAKVFARQKVLGDGGIPEKKSVSDPDGGDAVERLLRSMDYRGRLQYERELSRLVK